MQKGFKTYLGYSLYGVLLALFLLYWLFPSEAVSDYLESRVGKLNPQLELSIEDVRPCLPVGLALTNSTLYLGSQPRAPFLELDRLRVKPRISQFVQGHRFYDFTCPADSGKAEGWIHLEGDDNGVPVQASLRLDHLPLQSFSRPKAVIRRDMDGILTGTLNFRGKFSFPVQGNGEAELRISNGRIDLLQPIMNLQEIEFSEATVAMKMEGQRISLSRIEIQSRQFQATASGHIALKKDLANSRLNLRGSMKPFPGLIQKGLGALTGLKAFREQLRSGNLNFMINGTLSQPRLRFT